MSPAELRVVLLILGFLDSTLGDPCVNHTVLDQPWRSADCSNTECTSGELMDDRNLAVRWYRFNSSGGWKIPESVVPKYRCSGYYPGWLNGSHSNVEEGEVTRTVCFTVGEDTCYWSLEIRVKNCSGYFVYQLGPAAWYYAVYCTEPMSDTSRERQGLVTGEPDPGLTTSPAGSVSSGTDSQSDTTWEAQETMTGEPGLGLTTSPAGSLSSDLEASTLEQSTGLSTGEHTQELSSVPAGDTSSDLEVSTMDQPDGSSTGQPTPSPSSVSVGETSSVVARRINGDKVVDVVYLDMTFDKALQGRLVEKVTAHSIEAEDEV
ncbi:oncoprotein-induced transcript 3 protein-like [Mobula hypostoma]|uniref:oncoprotein-induced transcript 3 protein-like n=1 Tax=Mobula hypostoma TaxID=723540 RepID=UPI002FC37F89